MTATQAALRPRFLEDRVILPGLRDFDPAQALDCGQAFRWKIQDDGSFIGIAREKICQIAQEDDTTCLLGANREDFEMVWRDYLDLDRDYGDIKARLSEHPVFAKAVAYAPGVRLLRQDSWEALCSFIISQNNNVPRIKGIVERLCQLLGKPLAEGLYAFPEPAALAACAPEDLAPLRAGFRARYLVDAARKVTDGTVDLPALRTLPLEDARAQLMRITGVGVKVADCALLYGCGRLECFPVDVWIRRAMERLLPEGLPECAAGCEGIAQQYLFHYARTCESSFA